MARSVKCIKLGIEAEGLDRPPYPGELGKRIFENVSKQAWQSWLRQQTMLINEYRLTPFEPKARQFLEEQMTQFFFGEGAALPVRATRMVLLRSADGEVLLERRPPSGIWGGLWGFPECPAEVNVADWCRDHFGLEVEVERPWQVLRHTFSHFHLDITPVPARVCEAGGRVMEGERFVWYKERNGEPPGMAAPVRTLLAALTSDLLNP